MPPPAWTVALLVIVKVCELRLIQPLEATRRLPKVCELSGGKTTAPPITVRSMVPVEVQLVLVPALPAVIDQHLAPRFAVGLGVNGARAAPGIAAAAISGH